MHPHPRQNNTFTGLFGGYEALLAAPHRFGFNGKESDSEVKGEGNQQDYGMRVYDNRLGRFLSVDPISQQYPELTSFQFASNTPISAIDIDGLESNKEYTPKNVERWQRNLADPYDLLILGKKPEDDEIISRKSVALQNVDNLTTFLSSLNSILSVFPGASVASLMHKLESSEEVSGAVLLASIGWAIVDVASFGEANQLKLFGATLKYGNGTSNLIKFTGKILQGEKVGKEIISVTKSGKFSTAITVAKGIIGDLGKDAKYKVGKFLSQDGKVVGWQSADGSKGWRIDYDKVKGAHVNWWNGNEKGAVLFQSTEAGVENIIKNEMPKSLN